MRNTKLKMIVLIAAGITLAVSSSPIWSKPSQTATRVGVAYPKIPGIELIASTEKQSIASGEPIVVTLTIKNNTASTYSFIEDWPERNFQFEVKNEKNEMTPLTQYGKLITGPLDVLRRGAVNAGGGKQLQYKLLVNRLYDMTLSGTYTVIVKRYGFIPREDETEKLEKFVITSQPIQIKVLDETGN